MKRSLYLIALLGLMFVLPACQKDTVQQEEGLSSPAGLRIADNMTDLGEMISEARGTQVAKVMNVRWTKLEGYETAFIQYMDAIGNTQRVALTLHGSAGDIDPLLLAASKFRCEKVGCTDICGLISQPGPNPGSTLRWCECSIGDGTGCDIVEVVTP